MSETKDRAKVLQHRFSNHHHQTDGFKWDYTAATDEQVLETTNVFEDTITGLSTEILKAITPKQRPQLRREIAYLIGLRERQAAAWERYIADCEARTNNANQWVQQNTP